MRIQAFDFSVNLLRALLWQYNEAERLEALLRAKQVWYDENQTAFWEDWYTDVFDLRTANDFGLSVWAIILALPISISSTPSGEGPSWGFGSEHANFNNGNFASSGETINLTQAQKRLVLRLRYYQLVTRPSVTRINAVLAAVFGPGVAYVSDSLKMKIRYVFLVSPGPKIEFLLSNYDILPRPAGVGADYVISVSGESFGFGGFHANFDNGNFHA